MGWDEETGYGGHRAVGFRKVSMDREMGGGRGRLNNSGQSSGPLDFVLLLLPIFLYCFSIIFSDGNLHCSSLYRDFAEMNHSDHPHLSHFLPRASGKHLPFQREIAQSLRKSLAPLSRLSSYHRQS